MEEKEKKGAVADFFLESSFVRSRIGSSIGLLFFFFFKGGVRFALFSVEIARRDRCTRRCTR